MRNYLYLLLILLSPLSATSTARINDGPLSSGSREGAVNIARDPAIKVNVSSARASHALVDCPSPYEEKNGLVVIEAENLTLPAGWQKDASVTNYTGSGYISWVNAENFNTPGIGIIETTIKVTKTGTYTFQWRNKVGKGTAGNEHNDSWLRFPDASDYYAEKGGVRVYPKGSGKTPTAFGSGADGWFKIFYNASGLVWAWNTLANDEDGMPVKVQFDTPGVYKLQISARASYHLLDRLVLYHTTVNTSTAQALTNPETTCSGATPGNRAPVVSNLIPDQVGTIGATFSYTVPSNTFTDIDGDALTYSASLNNNAALPAWLSFNAATRSFSGIPPKNGPASLPINVMASDGRGASASDSFVLTFSTSTTNTVPVLATIGSQTITIGQSVNFTAQATDSDVPAQSLTYSLAGPTQGSINSSTGAFSWTPAATGNFTVAIQVSDNGTPVLAAQEFVTVTVLPPVSQQSVVNFSLINADNDQEIRILAANDQLNLATLPTRNLNIRVNTNPATVGSVKMVLSGKQSRTQTDNGLPYALFGDTNGDFKAWIPAVGSYSLTATPYTSAAAADTAGTPLTLSFNVIDQVPRSPVIANAIPDQNATVGVNFSFAFDANTFTDPDGDAMTYSARLEDGTDLPEWLSFDGASRSFSGTPTLGSPASLTLKVTVNDAQGGSTSDSFVLNIAPPVVAGSWQTIVPTSTLKPTARFESGYVQAGEKFYLLGGRGIKPVQVYEPVGRTWVNAAPTPVDMHHFQAVTLDGLIYIVGALTGNFPAEPTIAQIHIYDPKANKWILGPEIPADRRRGTAGVVVYNNKIYVVGGNTKGHNNGYVAWFDEFDPTTGIWKTLPNAPHARDHFHAVIIGNKLYAAGGRRSSANTGQTFMLTVAEVDIYDFNTGQWSTSSNPIPTQRAGTTSAVLDGELIVIGGESAQPAAHNDTEALDINTGLWKRLANMQQGRHATQAIVNNGGIYIVAGSGAQGSAAISSQEVYFKGEATTPTGTPLTQSQLTAPSNVAVGAVAVNGTKNGLITLTNTGGNQAIVVSSITVSGSSEFSYASLLPLVVPAGQSLNIPVSFSPLSEGSKQATVSIAHSGAGGNLSVTVSGEATAANRPPVLGAIDSQTVTIGQALNFTAQATDPDAPAQNLTYSLDGPAQASINPSTGAFSWTPTVSGTFSLTVTVTDTGSPALTDKKVFTVTVKQSVVSFSLMNADNESEILVLTAGQTLNLATLPTRNLNIRANTNPATVGSVKMVLSGKQNRTQTDNGLPYALFGDTNGDFKIWIPAVGNYNLTATPYTGSAAAGTEGTPLTLSFSVIDNATTNQPPIARAGDDQTIALPINSVALNGSASTDPNGSIAAYSWVQQSGPNQATLTDGSAVSLTANGLVAGTYIFRLTVTDNQGATAFDEVTVTVNPASTGPEVVSFSLMNADNESEILVLTAGQTLNLATLPTRKLNIRVNTNPTLVGSVVMVLSGRQNRTQTETGAPYALFGDTNGNYKDWTPATGNYNLTATPYTAAGGAGTAGTPLSLSFTVTDQASAARLAVEGNAEIEQLLVKHYPNPFSESFTLQIKGQGTFPLRIYDLYGRVVWQQATSQAEQRVSLGSELGAGVYILQVGVGSGAKRYKLVKAQ